MPEESRPLSPDAFRRPEETVDDAAVARAIDEINAVLRDLQPDLGRSPAVDVDVERARTYADANGPTRREVDRRFEEHGWKVHYEPCAQRRGEGGSGYRLTLIADLGLDASA